MPWWKDFAQAEPDLAARVQALFEVRKHATLATLRADGAPRISGTEVSFADNDLTIGGWVCSPTSSYLSLHGHVWR